VLARLGLRQVRLPLACWLGWRRAVRALVPAGAKAMGATKTTSPGRLLRDARLRTLLRDETLGGFAMPADTIEFLWRALGRDRPATVLECGAGVSTLVLAAYALGQSPPAMVVSIEQDPGIAAAVEGKLAALGVREPARLVRTPVDGGGRYRVDVAALRGLLGARRVDWLVIDGPAGPPGCRANTLPELLTLCRPGAHWFLDDALREGELGILAAWRRDARVRIDGIRALGYGLASGVVRAPAGRAPAQP
jgi:hypothetical protein